MSRKMVGCQVYKPGHSFEIDIDLEPQYSEPGMFPIAVFLGPTDMENSRDRNAIRSTNTATPRRDGATFHLLGEIPAKAKHGMYVLEAVEIYHTRNGTEDAVLLETLPRLYFPNDFSFHVAG